MHQWFLLYDAEKVPVFVMVPIVAQDAIGMLVPVANESFEQTIWVVIGFLYSFYIVGCVHCQQYGVCFTPKPMGLPY